MKNSFHITKTFRFFFNPDKNYGNRFYKNANDLSRYTFSHAIIEKMHENTKELRKVINFARNRSKYEIITIHFTHFIYFTFCICHYSISWETDEKVRWTVKSFKNFYYFGIETIKLLHIFARLYTNLIRSTILCVYSLLSWLYTYRKICKNVHEMRKMKSV